jgi:hypothetical protein
LSLPGLLFNTLTPDNKYSCASWKDLKVSLTPILFCARIQHYAQHGHFHSPSQCYKISSHNLYHRLSCKRASVGTFSVPTKLAIATRILSYTICL